MKFAAIIPLVGCVWNMLLACFVLWHGFRNAAHRVFFFLGLSIAVWNLGGYFLLTGDDPETGIFWARFLWMGVIFIPLLLFHLSLIIAQLPVRKWVLWAYLFPSALAVANTTPLFIERVRLLGDGLYSVPGPLFPAFNVIFLMVFVSAYVLFQRRKRLARAHYSRLDALIAAQVCLIVLGTNDILPLIGFDKYPGTNITVYPYGSLAAAIYGIIFAYSVLQHQLLDVRIHVTRIAGQVIRFLFLFSIGLLLLLTATLLGPGQFNAFSFLSALAAIMVSGIVASIVFPRLFGSGSDSVEMRILGDRFEYQDQVRSFIQNMYWYSETQTLFDDLHELLTETFRLKGYKIILRDETTRTFSIIRSSPTVALRELEDLRIPSPIFQYFEWGRDAYLSLGETISMGSKGVLARQAREQLRGLDAQFCFALSSQNEPFGLLLVDQKISGEPYTATDINLLVLLVKNLSLMVNQIRLKTQILQNQELDLLGRMSRGMAHDLNNLLTPVWTLLQLSSEEGTNTFDEDLLPVALRNIKTMRAYIKEALFFSENLRPDIQLGRLDMLLMQAADLAKASRKKHVDINIEAPGEVVAEIDEVLLQRMVANLISNAIDASAEGSEVRVELTRLAKTEASRDWVRVRISDRGEGIRKEDLNRVFTPYFTTKNRGDENRGFGLGLAICRKIVNLHGGNLSIASQLKKGTTVQVDLPTRQIKQVQPPAVAST